MKGDHMAELYRARVVRVDSEGVFVEVPDLGEGAEWGPLQLLNIPLAAGDQVLVGSAFGAMEDLVLLGKMVLDPPAEPVEYEPPANSSFVLYYENEAARTAASLTLESGLSTWLDDEQRLDIYTDEGTPGWVSFYGVKSGDLVYPSGTQIGVGIVTPAATLDVMGGNVLDVVVGGSITGDTQQRVKFDAGGKLHWGPGNAVQDAFLERISAGALRVSSILSVNSGPSASAQITVERDGGTRRGLFIKNIGATGPQASLYLESSAGATATANALILWTTGDSRARHTMDHAGLMTWGPGGVTDPDTNFYRSTTARLKTDGGIHAATDVYVGSGANLPFRVQSTGEIGWGDGTAARDTNLYRNAASELKTDDSFTVGGNLSVAGVGKRIYRVRTSQTNLANDATPNNDAVLTGVTLDIGEWHLDVRLLIIGDAATDFQTNWGFTGTYTGAKGAMGPGITNTAAGTAITPVRMNGSNLGTAITYGTTGTASYFVIESAIVIVTVAGTWSLMWSQGTTGAQNSALSNGSYVIADRLS
jgi:hypothetical protein